MVGGESVVARITEAVLMVIAPSVSAFCVSIYIYVYIFFCYFFIICFFGFSNFRLAIEVRGTSEY